MDGWVEFGVGRFRKEFLAEAVTVMLYMDVASR
jgi:hypothetical protein